MRDITDLNIRPVTKYCPMCLYTTSTVELECEKCHSELITVCHSVKDDAPILPEELRS